MVRQKVIYFIKSGTFFVLPSFISFGVSIVIEQIQLKDNLEKDCSEQKQNVLEKATLHFNHCKYQNSFFFKFQISKPHRTFIVEQLNFEARRIVLNKSKMFLKEQYFFLINIVFPPNSKSQTTQNFHHQTLHF